MDSPDAFFRWLEIREENGIPLTTVQQLKIDADHSSLLARLREGGDVFPEPPPRAHSYPWCDLIKTGRALPFEVFQSRALHAGSDVLVIDQCDEWRILERLGEDQYIATYRIPDKEAMDKLRTQQGPRELSNETPMKLSASRWKVYVQGAMKNAPERRQWVVERIQ